MRCGLARAAGEEGAPGGPARMSLACTTFATAGCGGARNARRSRSQLTHASAASTATSTRRSGQREDIELASGARVLRQILHRADEAAARRRIFRRQLCRDDGAGPAANAREHGDVLLAVRTEIRDRLTDDARARLVLPLQRAGARVDGFEAAIHRAVEQNVARGHERAAPD